MGGEPSGEAGKSEVPRTAQGPKPSPRRPRRRATGSRGGKINWRSLRRQDIAGFLLVAATLCLWALQQFWFPRAGSPTATDIVANALSCARPFKPEEILEGLQRRDAIGPAPVHVIDGVPIFAVTRPFTAYGLVVRFVEGWDHAGKLFSPAPGTAPPRHVTVTVNGDKDYVESAIRQRLPAVPPDTSLVRYLDDRPGASAYAKPDVLTGIVCVLPED